MTASDIEVHIREIYGLECSDTTISRITDKILPVVREWQSGPLEEIYAIVFMDAIHFHVRCDGRVIKKAVYIAIGIRMDGSSEHSFLADLLPYYTQCPLHCQKNHIRVYDPVG